MYIQNKKKNCLIFRHVIVSCQKEDKIKSKYAMAKVLRSLQVQTESFLILLLLCHALSHRFQLDREETIAEIALIFLSLFNLAKEHLKIGND